MITKLLTPIAIKVMLAAIVALVATNVGTVIAYKVAKAEAVAAAAKVDAADTRASTATTRARELADTNANWQTTVEVLNRKLDDANRENARLEESNADAVKVAFERGREAERTRRDAIAKRDAAAARDPTCRAFLEMPLCPALQARSSP